MDLRENAKQRAVSGMDMFLRNFAHIPEDKLTYQVTPTAKSPIRIAAHTALYAGRFAKMIRDRSLPAPENIDAWVAEREEEEKQITSREEMEAIFRKGTAEVLAAIDGLSDEELASSIDSGQGWSMPITQLIVMAGWHATLHTGQIDFLQTCWDDQHVYLS